MKKMFFIIGICILAFISCKKANPVEPKETQYLIFGEFYGECLGNKCKTYFKVNNFALYTDTLHQYPSQDKPLDFAFIRMDDTKYKQVNDILNELPPQLLNEITHVFGNPDSHDQGGVYIETMVNGEKKFWILDNDDKELPEYLKPFKQKIVNKFDILK